MTVELFIEIVGLFLSLGGALYMTVIRPIQKSLDMLRLDFVKSIDELRVEIAEQRKDRIALLERVHTLEISQAEFSQSLKLFQKRLDELFGPLKEIPTHQ